MIVRTAWEISTNGEVVCVLARIRTREEMLTLMEAIRAWVELLPTPTKEIPDA